MRRVFCIVLLCFTGCAAYDRAWKWEKYPGAMRRNHCSEYAAAVVKDLRAQNIEAYYVAYQWKTYDDFGPLIGRHAVVVFREGQKWKLVENENVNPITVTGPTLLKMVQWLNPRATAIITDYFELPNIPVGKGISHAN